MAMTQVREQRVAEGHSARAVRRSLRAERAQLLRWRRLLKARLDLAVASYAPPDMLGAMSWDILPDAQMALPHPQELLDAVRPAPEDDQVGLMQRLRELDRQLAVYQAHVEEALEHSTQEILGACASGGVEDDDLR